MNTQEENQASVRNSFPEPQTIPAGWDTSVFFSASASDSEAAVEDDTPES